MIIYGMPNTFLANLDYCRSNVFEDSFCKEFQETPFDNITVFTIVF